MSAPEPLEVATSTQDGAGPDVPEGAVPAPVIRFDGVGLTYPGPPAVCALRPCDLTVRRGEFVTVLGPDGSGKSTLLNVAGLLDRPSQGRYHLDGFDPELLPDRHRALLRARRIGFVFQAHHLLMDRTVEENVMLSMLYNGVPRAARTARAWDAVARVGLDDRIDASPRTLSGGERQRVAVARALVSRPRLLLCDEPTGALDSAAAAGVLELLHELHADGLTIVVMTHDLMVAAHGQRVFALRDGVLREESRAAVAG